MSSARADALFYKNYDGFYARIKNDPLSVFGRAADKFDDIVNYLPSRIAALLYDRRCLSGRLDEKMRIHHRRDKRIMQPGRAQTNRSRRALNIHSLGMRCISETLRKPTIAIRTDRLRRRHQRVNRLMSAPQSVRLPRFY
jgi:adenosylcobinamide-phosphate synthase